MTITFPYPPTTNHLYATIMRRGKAIRIPTREANTFKAAAESVLRASRVKPIEGPVSLVIDIYRPRRAGDLDGRLKALIDSMTGHVYADDEQVVQITARRFEDKVNPRAVVTISPAPTETEGAK